MVFPFECPVCGHKTNMPQTNADRIRAMSDEELAKMLTIGEGGFDCSTCEGLPDCRCCEQNCEKQCLRWLQQPPKEG